MSELVKVLSLGAGVQSTAVLRLAIHGEIERPDHVIFADTGWEPQAVYDHLEVLEMEMRGADIDFHVVGSGNIRRDHVASSGINADGSNPPSLPYFTFGRDGHGMTPRQCTNNYKIGPVNKKIREICEIKRRSKNNRLPLIEMWLGISTDELKRTRLNKNWWAVNYYPLIELGMSRDDCLSWMDRKGYPEPPRSACIGCPYKSDNEWRRLRDESHEEWLDAIDFDHAIRRKPGLDNERFLHRQAVPLELVDLSTPEDHGQINMFRDNECAGMCGV